MEIDHLWTAANWDPEKLMELYVAAGAKYFVALANHHDNFDAYDSKYQAWNSVNVGPKRTSSAPGRRSPARTGCTSA